ncbi:CRISPR-associated protein [Spongiactinospora gelatinilytica]|uniref:CRISPR-associated protein n=1 Tax=Spongiactinospora gelatinilytica TaxID=2666298 RepID=A0A2W2HG67_9ACTN|nr:CRISPR-associated protein Cas4 [Spongiactinospora gelatinilytica]PZG45167.1 CRISPR-associated protein [Spongiactinospora gelatinilytica]
MSRPEDEAIGGVHIKYLLHCPRQLWLYIRGYRPEQRSDTVAHGQAVDDTTYTRRADIDLGEAKIDWVTTGAIVHETKSSRAPSAQHEAQVRHYCLLLSRRGVNVRHGVVHYPLIRRTVTVAWDASARDRAEETERQARQVISQDAIPPRLERRSCHGCSYIDYCWGES